MTVLYKTDQAAQRFVEHNTHDCAGPRPMTGFFASLSPAGQEAALAYFGEEPSIGDDAFRIGATVHNPHAASIVGLSAAWRDRAHMANDNRHGDFMQTFSGRKFWPLDPRADEVHIEDIAHALSMQCRYGGHCTRFYSVAEHSVLMARTFANRDLALWALLHDAAEAYVADVPRPLKRFLPGYKEAENKVMVAICDRFGLPPEIPHSVHVADSRIIADEMQQNMHEVDPNYTNPLGVTLQFWDPERACEEFLLEFWDLSDRMDRRVVE